MKDIKEAKTLKIMVEIHSSTINKTIPSNYSNFHLQINTLLECLVSFTSLFKKHISIHLVTAQIQ